MQHIHCSQWVIVGGEGKKRGDMVGGGEEGSEVVGKYRGEGGGVSEVSW